jgi:hypothetical protein
MTASTASAVEKTMLATFWAGLAAWEKRQIILASIWGRVGLGNKLFYNKVSSFWDIHFA